MGATSDDIDAASPASAQVTMRTGPVSRLLRLLGAGLAAWIAYDLGTAGLAGFSELSTLQHPGVWLLGLGSAVMLYEFAANIGHGPRSGRRAVAVLLGLAGLAALVTVAISGAVWAVPLTWLLYGLYLAMFAAASVLTLLSAILGTPGCPSGVLHRPSGVDWCAGGLHRLDRWEAARRESTPRLRA